MRRSVLPALALTVVLAGCGFSEASDGDADGSGTTVPSASETAGADTGAGTVALNERGNVPTQLGEEVVVRSSLGPDGPPMLTLTLQEVAVDPVCDDDSEVPPENGHYVALLLRAEASPEFDPRVVTVVADYDFSVLGADGGTYPTVTESGRACFGAPRLIQNMRVGAGEEYVGWMVLDVAVDGGTLVYAPGDAPHGWEWEF